MNMQIEINDNLLNRIITVAYGDAGLIEKIKIHLLAIKHTRIKNILNEYKQTAKAVEQIEIDKCPDEIIEKVKNNTGVIKDNAFVALLTFVRRILWINQLLRKPVFTAAIILMIISSVVSLFLLNQKNQAQISNKHVALAEKQVKQSIVFVNRIFERTAGRVENDIIKQQVARPVQEGISTINNLFKGG